MAAFQVNACRQPKASMSGGLTSGNTALPRLVPMRAMPMASPRCFTNQLDTRKITVIEPAAESASANSVWMA